MRYYNLFYDTTQAAFIWVIIMLYYGNKIIKLWSGTLQYGIMEIKSKAEELVEDLRKVYLAREIIYITPQQWERYQLYEQNRKNTKILSSEETWERVQGRDWKHTLPKNELALSP